jgi:hypothetical protein
MAYFVAKKLHLRPNEILNHWGISELIVTYGIYANEDSQKNFYEVQEYNKTSKKKMQLPKMYAVKFYRSKKEFKGD